MNAEQEATPPDIPPCEGCGKDSEAVIDGKGWCVDCYAAMGSCCSAEWATVLIAGEEKVGQESR